MIFTYNNKRYKTKETLEDLEYLMRYVDINQCSGILTNLPLEYQGNFPDEQRRPKRSVNDDLSKLESLGVVYVTMQGGRETIQVKNEITDEVEEKHHYIYSRYLIDKDRFVTLYRLCSCPLPNPNTAYFKKNPPRLDFNRLLDFLDTYRKTSNLDTAFRSVGIGKYCDSDNKTDMLFRFVAVYLVSANSKNTYLDNNLTPRELLPRFALLNRIVGTPHMLFSTVSLDRVDNLPTPTAHDTPTSRISVTYADAGACDGSLGGVDDFDDYIKCEISQIYGDTNIDLSEYGRWPSSIVLGPGVSVNLSPDTSHVMSSSIYTGGFPHHTVPQMDKVWFTDRKEKTYKRTDMAILQPEEEFSYKSRPEIVKQMKAWCKSQAIDKFRFETETRLTEDEIEDFKVDYANCLVRNNNLLKCCCCEVHRIRELSVRKDMHFNLNIEVREMKREHRKNKFVYYASISGRHHNTMASVPSKLRSIVAQAELSSLDLHSASFAILRLFNTSEFKVCNDIKNDIIRSGLMDYLDVAFEEKRELLKPILYRCIFSADRNDAYNKYYWALREGNVDRRISLSKFMKLYDYVQEWVGGSDGRRVAIFFLESLFELTVTRTLMESFPEGGVENVYDCFYYLPTHIKEADVEETCDTVANEITVHYNRYRYAQPGTLGIRA